MTSPATAPRRSARQRWEALSRALRHRNYRLFFIGQFISTVGTWMQMIALGWLVQRLTGSEAMLGLVGFLNRAPALLSPLAGVWVDRLNLRRLVFVCQLLCLAQAIVLGLLTLHELITIQHILALSLGLGVVSAIEIPARQAFLVEMVTDRDDLPNAIALNSSIFHGARLFGPALAGTIIAVAGEGQCFLLNGYSYVAVLVALALMRVTPRPPAAARRSVLADLRAGVRYVAARPPLRDLMLLVAFVGLVGMPYPVLLPAYAQEVLDAGPRTYGWLMTCGAIGALSAALFLAQRESARGLGRIVPLATCTLGLGCVLFGFSRWTPVSMMLMPFLAASMMTQMASANTVLVSLSDDEQRGRVMGLHTLASMGTAPWGSLICGQVAERFGVPAAFWLGGGMAVAAGLCFFARTPRLAQHLAAASEVPIFGETPERLADSAD